MSEFENFNIYVCIGFWAFVGVCVFLRGLWHVVHVREFDQIPAFSDISADFGSDLFVFKCRKSKS
jgi:hypothetical protein